MEMDKRKAIEFLRESLNEIPSLVKLPYDNDDYPLWYSTIEGVLEKAFGQDSREFKSFFDAFSRVGWSGQDYQQEYRTFLKMRETALLSIIRTYEIVGIEAEVDSVAEPPKAFIAHEGQPKALEKLEDFLDALGIKHSIAEKSPSDGRLVEPQVTQGYQEADFVIILATKGKVINKKTGASYMGLNVADELGRAREANKRVILLLQERVEPHTNISGIVYERFTPQSMDKAFTKIIRELRNWGYLKVGEI